MKRRNLLISTGLLTGAAIAQTSRSALAEQRLMKEVPATLPKPLKPNSKRLRGKMVAIAQGLNGYQVMPEQGNGPFPTVLVIMEAFGLNDQIKSVCDLYASYGYGAIAPDIYGGTVFAYDQLGGAVAKLKTLNDEVVVKQVGQTLDFIGTQPKLRSDAVGTVGFCMGGRYAFLLSATFADRIHSAVCFYGGGIASEPDPLGRVSLLPLVPQIQSPVMLIYSAEDEYINGAEHARITQAMSDNRKRYVLSVVPNTQHGFMNDARSTYNESAAMESWDMAFGFFKRHLKNRPS
ncbi:MAG: dienelactone hydrolase family protein [Synechococcales cyanobacterium RU_4_20]|nr:dienelactone hydrolase family protein [Synechococcales cyanobacterium RU_4_20]NJR67421.1 dienelactone hydrolase family protein [Synechococcales cyanobacterium CRU_2_2]